MPVTATPWRTVPSTPARSAYLAWKSLVSAAARAASCAWCTCRGCTVSWRRCDAEVVHSSRTGHGPQSALEKVITMVGVAGGQPALQQFEITGGTRPDLEPEPISQQAGVPPQPSAPPHPAGDRTSGLYRSTKPSGCHGRTTVGGIRSTRVAPRQTPDPAGDVPPFEHGHVDDLVLRSGPGPAAEDQIIDVSVFERGHVTCWVGSLSGGSGGHPGRPDAADRRPPMASRWLRRPVQTGRAVAGRVRWRARLWRHTRLLGDWLRLEVRPCTAGDLEPLERRLATGNPHHRDHLLQGRLRTVPGPRAVHHLGVAAPPAHRAPPAGAPSATRRPGRRGHQGLPGQIRAARRR